MSIDQWVEILGAHAIGERVFAARRPRKTPENGPASRVQHIEFPYRRWDGPIGEWSEHFGKGRGQVYALDETEPLRSCNEVEVAKRLRLIRDHAYWFSGYDTTRMPAIWRPWVSTLATGSPAWLRSLDATIRELIPSRAGGMPDVVAWNDVDSLASALFVECKSHGEPVSDAQEDWVWAARMAGVTLDQIIVSIRRVPRAGR
jgi:VRR-NUC domain